MTLYERLSALGMKMQPEEREAVAKIEYVLRRLQTKYDDDDLGELADQVYRVSHPITVETPQ